MKKTALVSSIIALILVVSANLIESNGQRGEEKKKLEKRIEVRIENDEKTVKVTTTEDGATKEEIYSGSEADDFIDQEKKINKSVRVIEDEKEIDELLKDLDIDIDIKVNDGSGKMVKKKVVIISDEKEIKN